MKGNNHAHQARSNGRFASGRKRPGRGSRRTVPPPECCAQPLGVHEWECLTYRESEEFRAFIAVCMSSACPDVFSRAIECQVAPEFLPCPRCGS